MKDSFIHNLFWREINDVAVRSKSYRQLYSDLSLINRLDIVNELDGHSGCVNALSWSKSGALLASGSDDQHLNIHTYQPQGSTTQFQLTTTVATGHTANIFSVKFMPHSNDRTVVTAAGDSEVRIFDLEYSGHARTASAAAGIATESRRRMKNIYNDVRYLSDGDTDCRVYRSHGDRVKRIVTESSPYLFLTCSEDGEVRQWDLRQPSSAYPSPRGSRLSSAQEVAVPPPLISYKRYNLDLNTISCSASQPHYIALGGAHLHAFLHDRRMTGRDRLRESGKPLPSVSEMTPAEQELMGQATQCVRKFAPSGQRKMKRTDNGHITACKISDARPNEMVVSWSGEYIYSFDLIHSPAAGEDDVASPLPDSSASGRARQSYDRKRKRKENDSQTSVSNVSTERVQTRQRRQESQTAHDTALRVRYQNGQSEDIALAPLESPPVLTEKERMARGIAGSVDKLKSSILDRLGDGESHATRFSAALSHAARSLEDMDEIMKDWRYPINPSPIQVHAQQSFRRDRESSRRFVQAAGTLARALGGKPQTSSGTAPFLSHFLGIEAKTNELEARRTEMFYYDFIKAILLWLESGIGRLIEGFTLPATMSQSAKVARRLPIPESEATTESVEEILVPYLLRLAEDKPIVDVEVNQFEVADRTNIYASEKDAVMAFAAAVQIPFADLSSAVMHAESEEHIQAQDRQTAIRFWGLKVCRGVLRNASELINFPFVCTAFVGFRPILDDANNTAIPSDGNNNLDEPLEVVEVVDADGNMTDGATVSDLAAAFLQSEEIDDATENTQLLEADAEAWRQPSEETEAGTQAYVEDEDDNDGEDTEDEPDHDDDSEEAYDSSELDEEDGVPNLGLPRFMYHSAFERRRIKERVEADVPCSPYTRVYRGHCNVKTVKDVNYFGLNDEYVVSGSDDGNFFIWDQKTSELVNVLEGDGEVVNVIQGHPYETMLAVSGIDHTIKIFSPDARAREAARLGTQGIFAHDSSAFSSLSWPSRMARRVPRGREAAAAAASETTTPTVSSKAELIPGVDIDDDDDVEDEEEYVAPNGLASRKRMHDLYRITSQNEADRQGGNQDAFLTRSMLNQLATRIRAHRAATGMNEPNATGNQEEQRPLEMVIDDDCVMQ